MTKQKDHETFATPEDGVRAHYNHMAAYVGLAPVGEPRQILCCKEYSLGRYGKSMSSNLADVGVLILITDMT